MRVRRTLQADRVTTRGASLLRRATGLVVIGGMAAVLLTAAPVTAAERIPLQQSPPVLSLETFWQQQFVGTDLRVGRRISTTSAYTRYAITYRSQGLRISGVMNVPRGKGPFPVVILAHGYIDPAVYRTGQGLAREQDYLARRGFIALHTDYRNHATSDDDLRLLDRLRLGYTEDVINAALAIKASRLPYVDPERVSLLGRSMGGGIGWNALVTAPGLFDSAILYASVSTKAAENTRRWLSNDPVVRTRIFDRYGTPSSNPAWWNGMSAYTHLSRVSDPVLVHHGTADDTCPIRWADQAVARMRALDKTISYRTYRGAGHTFYGRTWDISMKRTVDFLRSTQS